MAPSPDAPPSSPDAPPPSPPAGVLHLDRAATYSDVADAATDTGLPYWLTLTLAGAIATLGLALNSAAVVIGAMLVAPLLSPVIGLGLALAAGDTRLALQTLAAIAVSTVAVVAVGAVLTAMLPYHDVTAEIAARTRPTLLDLAVAVFSGLAGALVAVARGSRFAGAGPGVAVAVALAPPLAVAGFGVGAGFDGALIRGSLLLYSANLGGIVLSAVAVFLAVGMYRPDVLAHARAWHATPRARGLAALVERGRAGHPVALLRTPWARVGLVLAFVVLVAVPLAESLRVIARETRVERAVDAAAEAAFGAPGRSFVLGRQVVLEAGRTRAFLRVATEAWFSEAERAAFERDATARAGEPVEAVLEQVPAVGADLERFAALFGSNRVVSAPTPPPAAAPSVGGLLGEAEARAAATLAGLALPDSVALLPPRVTAGGGTVQVVAPYVAPAPLSADARTILARQAGRALGGGAVVSFEYAADERPRAVAAALPDSSVRALAAPLARYPGLRLEVAAGPDARPGAADSLVARLARLGVAGGRVSVVERAAPGLSARVRVAPRRSGAPG